MSKGFTLLEILLVVAAIGILAAIVIVAINPNRQLAQARNAARSLDVNTLYDSLIQYTIENGSLPPDVESLSDGTIIEICASGALDCAGSLNLEDDLVPSYLGGIPLDFNALGNESGYQLYRDVDSQQGFGIIAPNAELERTIVAGAIPVSGPPAQIANLVFWLDGGVGVALNGSGVSSWSDRSGNGYLFEQPSVASQPTYNETGCSDGLPAISFDGTDFVEEILSTNTYTRSDLTIFFVHRITTGTSWATLFRFGGRFNGAVRVPQLGMIENNAALGIHETDTSPDNISVSYGSYPLNDWYVSSLKRVNYGQPEAAWEVRSNALFASGADWGGSDLNDYIQIGSYTGGGAYSYVGDVCEVIMYSQALSDTDRESIENYLSNKYSINF
jgi:prepilin-type N-terminal cleavage/methylation domain-containing protein